MKTANKFRSGVVSIVFGFSLAAFFTGCSSSPPVKTQAYAKLKNERAFEYEFPAVWKAIEETLRRYRVVDRDPSDVDPVELKRLSKRTLDTDWIYGQSRDKYQEYQINGTPRKKYLQTRLRYHLEAKKVIGGVQVTVKTDEEIERLNSDGNPDGYSSSDEVDPSRASELLDKIQNQILAAPNI